MEKRQAVPEKKRICLPWLIKTMTDFGIFRRQGFLSWNRVNNFPIEFSCIRIFCSTEAIMKEAEPEVIEKFDFKHR